MGTWTTFGVVKKEWKWTPSDDDLESDEDWTKMFADKPASSKKVE